MPSVDNLDFLNTNALRNYPIKEGNSRVNADGTFTIPNDFIVDMQLAVSYDPSKRFYISRLTNFDDTITIEITDQSAIFVGSFNIVVANHWQYKDYYFTASQSYEGATGILTITSLKSILNTPSGVYDFTLTTAEIEPRAIVPSQRAINRMVFSNSNNTSFYLTGDVSIVARTNLRFKIDPTNSSRVIIDAGDGLGLDTICSNTTNCIKTINGIPPDESSNFTLDFSDCATLTPIPANTGLLLEDICCKPCVGCNDIEELTNRLMNTETGLVTLRQFYSNLDKLFLDFKTTQTYVCDCPPDS